LAATRDNQLDFLNQLMFYVDNSSNLNYGTVLDLLTDYYGDFVKATNFSLADLQASVDDRVNKLDTPESRGVGRRTFAFATDTPNNVIANKKLWADVMKNLASPWNQPTKFSNLQKPLHLIHGPVLRSADFALSAGGWPDATSITALSPEIPNVSRFGLTVATSGSTVAGTPTITMANYFQKVAGISRPFLFAPVPILSWACTDSTYTSTGRAYLSGDDLKIELGTAAPTNKTFYFNVLCVG
jgi:hypothetical protein